MMINNENKKGYKKTKLGWIPEDWTVMTLDELGVFSKGIGITKAELVYDGLPCVRYGEIYTTHNFIIKEFVSFTSVEVANKSKEIKEGDILFAGSGETIEEIGKSVAYCKKEKAYAGGDVIILSTNKNANAECLSYALETDNVRKQKRRLGQGNSVVHIYPRNLSSINIPLPPLPEQKAIANLLSTWDEAITKTKSLITKKELRKKWLMQNLLTGKKRFPEYIINDKNIKTKVGELPKDWEIMYVSDLLIRVRNQLIPKLNELYKEIGIRSHTKGIFYKKSVTGKSLGNKSVFWIQPDCFIVNIVFAWEHAVAKTTENEKGMIASHRFPMYKPKRDILDLEYLLYFFKSKRGKHLLGLASPGGAGRNKTLGQAEFMKLQIPVPDIAEQQKIASVIKASDKEIETLKAKLDKLKKQKKGLMQILLTGKKRLNYDL